MNAMTGLALAGVMSLAASAFGQTATFDSYQEGVIGTDFTDAGIRFHGYDNRLDPPPSTMTAEMTTDLTGLPHFTAPNALGFGGYSQGNGSGFGRFGELQIEPAGGTANMAAVYVYEFANDAGITITLEASLNGQVVDSDTISLQGGFTIQEDELLIKGTTFDHLRMYVGPTQNDAAFILVDTVTVTTEASGLSLDQPSPGHAGASNMFDAHGATPGARVYFVYSLHSGSTGVPGCPGVTVGMNGPSIAGSDVADGNGDAEIVKFVPSSVRGRHVLIQAVEQSGCEVSNLVDWIFD